MFVPYKRHICRFKQVSKEITDRRKKRCDCPINISPKCMSSNVKFSIPTKTLESCSHFFSFPDQSPCINSHKM